MKRVTYLVVAALLCWALVPASSVRSSTLSWRCTLDASEVRFQEEGARLRATVDGYRTLEILDYPALPYRVVSLLVPQGETVSSCRFEVLDEVTLRLEAELDVFRGIGRDDGIRSGARPGAAEAEENAASLERRVAYLGSSVYRGYTVASFALYPLAYDGAARELAVTREANLVVETAPAPSAASGVRRLRRIEGFREESRRYVESMVVNPEAAAGYAFEEIEVDPGTRTFLPSYEPSMEGSDVAYVIVTNEAMAPAFQRLADWKTEKGIPAVVRTVEWIEEHYRWGTDVGESVRGFLQDAYAKWGVEWVVLGGDTDVIPARFAHSLFTYEGDQSVPADLYYSGLDGTWNADGDSLWGEAFHSVYDPGDDADLYSEVYLGRMPVSTPAEAAILIDKTIDYAAPTDAGSKKKFLMLAEVIFPGVWNPGETILLDGASITEGVYQNYLAGNAEVVPSRLYENYTAYSGSLPLTKTLSLDSLEAGVNHVLHCGHGASYNMSVGDNNILNYDAATLTNGAALFALYIMSCKNGAFDSECIAESFLLNPNGGAFAATASSRSAYPSASWPYLDEYYRLLFAEDIVQLGKLQTLSRLPFTPSAVGETADRWTHFIYNYLGDPEACIFQGNANTLDVARPASATFGANDITITVTSGGAPVDSAYVCLYKEGDDYVHAVTDPAGTVLFEDFFCKSAGAITVTVTGRNYGRYSETIPVTQLAASYLRVSDRAVSDAIVGNGDGTLDAGETVSLAVELGNTGQTSATGISATIRSADPDVTVTDSTALFSTIAAGAERWGSDGFVFSVLPAVADGRVIEFAIDVRTSTGGFWSEKFAFEVHAPRIELFVNTVSDTLPYGDNDGVIEEGETVLLRIAIKNFGTGAAYGLQGLIHSLDANIVVVDSASAYADLPLLGASCGDGFVISESNITAANYFQFEVVDSYGRTYGRTMELRRPGAPGMLLLDATRGSTEILATWRAPDALEEYRYLVYHSLTAGGPYELASRDLLLYRTYLDRGLLASTRYYYVVTAVDSCGNEGPRSAEVTVTTSPAQLAGWPLQVAKETASSVKIGDIDGDAHPDVVVGSDRIYAWHADGTELRDGDAQPLTWGVFSDEGDNFTATVALANLDGVAGLEIVGASWATKQIFIFNKNGEVLAGWPKTTAYLCWASPAVGDIDGDEDLEVIAYDVAGIVYAWHVDGSEVRDGDGNAATVGPFFVTKNPGTWHLSTPALADMDEDGTVELIVCAPADSIYCMNGDGSRVPGWPVPVADTGANITQSPAAGDIDGDGHLEMVVPSSAGRIYGLNHDGTTMTGWPRWINSNTNTLGPSPALADLDDDGKLEVVIGGMDKKVYVIRYSGTAFPGWPQTYSTTAASESSPVVADVNGDGSLDILFACEEGTLFAWTSGGEIITGFPIETRSYLRGTPVLQDLDFDGDVELAASCWNTNVYIWDLEGAWYRGFAPWNGFHANIYNSGWLEFIPATDAGRIMCMVRLAGDAIELSWTVPAEVSSWRLYRETQGGERELLGAALRAEQPGMLSFVDETAEAGTVYTYTLEAEDRPDLSQTTDEIMLPAGRMSLSQNHPNPFNPSTAIAFLVPGGIGERRDVRLAVFDVNGRLVKTLASGSFPAGRHEARWDGRNERGEFVATGVYFARLAAGDFQASRKMVLLR